MAEISKPKLYLAPMEGVVDWVLRDILTSIGGIDQCVTEFIRVTDMPVVDKVFYEYCPELRTGSKTRAGVPVHVQLLGGHAKPLAENALRAVELGASGIDLNFGCPAKTVNRHDGGATLLQYPDRIFNILSAVRAAVPAHVPVSAKIRLGFDNPEMCIQNALAVEAAGIETLAVHCRTKTDMYKPPAFWDWIPKIKAKTSKLNIIANGEIWNTEDLKKCREVTGCDHLMIGRGAIANPFIFRQCKGENVSAGWPDLKPFLPRFFDASTEFKSEYFAQSRTKQWLNQIGKRNAKAEEVFNTIKVEKNPHVFRQRLVELTA